MARRRCRRLAASPPAQRRMPDGPRGALPGSSLAQPFTPERQRRGRRWRRCRPRRRRGRRLHRHPLGPIKSSEGSTTPRGTSIGGTHASTILCCNASYPHYGGSNGYGGTRGGPRGVAPNPRLHRRNCCGNAGYLLFGGTTMGPAGPGALREGVLLTHASWQPGKMRRTQRQELHCLSM